MPRCILTLKQVDRIVCSCILIFGLSWEVAKTAKWSKRYCWGDSGCRIESKRQWAHTEAQEVFRGSLWTSVSTSSLGDWALAKVAQRNCGASLLEVFKSHLDVRLGNLLWLTLLEQSRVDKIFFSYCPVAAEDCRWWWLQVEHSDFCFVVGSPLAGGYFLLLPLPISLIVMAKMESSFP